MSGLHLEHAPERLWRCPRCSRPFASQPPTHACGRWTVADHFAGKPRAYAPPRRLMLNHWALDGDWTMQKQAIRLNRPNGRIVYRFHARDLHLVMGPAARGAPARFRVLIDGKPPGAAHGVDVDPEGHGTAAEQRLYHLIRQPMPIADRLFEIEFLEPGIEAFAFTFG